MTLLDDSHMTDPGLVAEVRLGRREAFGELYRRYYSGALRYALSITRGDEAHAQDIVSEAFTRVFRAMSRNGNVSAFWPYLLASVRNAHRSELRRSVRVDLVERPDELDDLVPEAPSDSDQEDPGIRAAFRRLPPRWQTVLWRTEICGDTAAEIGQDLGISANAAAALALRAREGLRVQYLQHRLEYAPPGCRPFAEHLARLVRGVLGRRDRRHVEAHLRGCKDCQRAVAELTALNSRMRSVLPLILGVWPFASGQGMSFAPAGAAGSGLLGSAGAAATGVAGTAGITGGTTGAVGLAAIGVGHVGAVAGLAVASVVAVLGLPMQPSAGGAGSQPPVVSVGPDSGVGHDAAAAAVAEPLAEPVAEGSEAEPPAEQAPTGTGLMMAPPSEPALSGESVTTSGGTDADASTETADTTGLAEGGSLTESSPDAGAAAEPDPHRPTDPGSQGDNGGGPESRDAEPFGLSSPAADNAQGPNHWPEDGDGAGPGHSGVAPGKAKLSDPAKGPGRAESGQEEAPAPVSSAVPAKPGHAAQPARTGPAQPAQPPKKEGSEDSTPDPPTQPIPAATPANTGPVQPARPTQALDSTGSGERARPEGAGGGRRTPPDVRQDTDVTQVTSVGRHASRGSRISRLQAFTRQR